MRSKAIFPFLVVFFICFYASPATCLNAFDIYYQQGKIFFESRDYPKAYEAFLTAFKLSPGNWEVDFFLGRSAFETGDFEMAVMAFERALMSKPDRVRVKLEMARAYHGLGANDVARKFCDEVLQTNPPPKVQENIRKFLSYIDKSEQKHFFKSAVAMGIDFTDNVWASPTSNIINTAIGQVVLEGTSAEKKEDWIFNTSAVLNHTFKAPGSQTAWSTTAIAAKSIYHDADELDTEYFGIESGPQLIKDKHIYGMLFTVDYVEVDDAQYQTSLGFKNYYRYLLTPTISLAPSLQVLKKNHHQNEERDAQNISLALNTDYLTKDNRLSLALAVEQEDAEDDEFSYQRGWASFSASRKMPWDITLFGSYGISYTSYDEIGALFTQEREDTAHQGNAGVKKQVWMSQDKLQSVHMTLKYQFTNSNSNVGLYDYRKSLVQSFLEYRF